MKRFIGVFLFVITIAGIVIFRQEITTFIMRNIIYRQDVKLQEVSIYQKKNDYFALHSTDDFIIKNQVQILDVIYTVLNNGWSDFTFFCDYDYPGCVDDVKDAFNDNIMLSSINAAVHPFNSYKNIELRIGTQNNLTFSVTKLYSEEEIATLNNKVNGIYNELTNDQMSTRDKLLAIHDYIVNHTAYDKNYVENVDESNTAYGPLIENSAICSGYTDAMQLFLIKMGITNYKLTSEDHIWNYIYLDNKWYNLDVTWDDQLRNGKEYLLHDYFLISDEQLKAKHDGEHNYNNMFLIEKKS